MVDIVTLPAYIAPSNHFTLKIAFAHLMNNLSSKLILLDLGNVLLDYHPDRFAGRLSKIAPHRSTEEIFQRYTYDLKPAFERGLTTEADFFAEMVEWLGLRIDAVPLVMDFWCDCFTITPGADHAVEKLAEQMPLWLLSDTNETHLNFALRRYPFLNRFERVFASYQSGHFKTEPEAFVPILAAADCQPEEIIFYDDLESNVATARSVGIDARVFRNWRSVMDSLASRIFHD
jgi:FMN phosphatase YigB (HAD superfamily)